MEPVITPTEDFFEDNANAFKERYGIELKPVKDSDRFTVERARDGSKILYVAENDRRIRMNSSYDPAHEALRWAGRFDELRNVKTTMVVEGLLNGYFLRALRHTLRENIQFVVYEPSEELFAFVCRHFNLTDIFADERIRLVLPSMDQDKLFDEIRDASSGGARNQIMVVITPGYVKDRKFTDICEQIRIINEAEEGFNRNMAREAFRNFLCAVSSLHNNYLVYDLWKVLPTELPVFLVAGGPSLLKNVEELKRVKGKGLIVAVDRAVSVLLNHNIVPDIMVTIDSTKDPTFLDHEGIENSYLLCGFSANRASMRLHDGHLIFMHSDVRYKEIPGLEGRLLNFGDVGGGVAPAAFIHFLYMKVDNLVLVGQDLAIEGTQTHADGKNDMVDMSKLSYVEGINGGQVRGRWDLDRFRVFMEKKIREYPDTVVTDATEGGALIHGTKIRTLKETIDELCDKDYDIDRILSSMPHGQTEEQHSETMLFMCKKLKELEEIKEVCPELEDLTHNLMNVCRYQDVGDKSSGRKIDHLIELRNVIYEKSVNNWLEDTWITDKNDIPDAFMVLRNNEEAYPVFAGANRYYKALPEHCVSLSEVIREDFGITDEEYRKRMGE